MYSSYCTLVNFNIFKNLFRWHWPVHYAYIHTYTHTHTHIHIHAHIYTYTYIYIHIYVCISMYVFIYVYVCILLISKLRRAAAKSYQMHFVPYTCQDTSPAQEPANVSSLSLHTPHTPHTHNKQHSTTNDNKGQTFCICRSGFTLVTDPVPLLDLSTVSVWCLYRIYMICIYTVST